MTNNMSVLAPYISIVGIIVVVILAFVILRFFWRHILKYLVQGCLAIVGILVLLAVLHYFRVF